MREKERDREELERETEKENQKVLLDKAYDKYLRQCNNI